MKVTLAPDVESPFSKAWEIDTNACLAKIGRSPDEQGCISQWIISAPWAHPIWSCYWLCMSHLRPFMRDGELIDNPLIYLPGATHELWLFAVQPNTDLDEQIMSGSVRVLSPINFAAQMIYKNDVEAVRATEETVQDILQGNLNPDTDALDEWISRFGNSMVKLPRKSLC